MKTKKTDRVAPKSRTIERAVYKVPEAAKTAGVGERSIRRGIEDNTIPHLRFGRNIVIPKAAFHAWLDSCGTSGQA
jgi:excisionase family DNA binding protein